MIRKGKGLSSVSYWERDTKFSIDNHVIHASLPKEGEITHEQMEAYISEILMEQFPEEYPPWTFRVCILIL